MAPAAKNNPSDEPPPGPGDWIVTFSDCMTLLLCFFVMLLTFSSFDEVEFRKLGKVLDLTSYRSIFASRKKNVTALAPPVERPVDRTEEGSEKPTQSESLHTSNPEKLPDILETEAYRDQKVFRIPSRLMFFGKGSRLKPIGKEFLTKIAAFMVKAPCKVIIGEVGQGADMAGLDGGLQRSWEVLTFFVRATGLAQGRFSISAGEAGREGSYDGRAVMVITLVAWDAYT